MYLGFVGLSPNHSPNGNWLKIVEVTESAKLSETHSRAPASIDRLSEAGNHSHCCAKPDQKSLKVEIGKHIDKRHCEADFRNRLCHLTFGSFHEHSLIDRWHRNMEDSQSVRFNNKTLYCSTRQGGEKTLREKSVIYGTCENSAILSFEPRSSRTSQ